MKTFKITRALAAIPWGFAVVVLVSGLVLPLGPVFGQGAGAEVEEPPTPPTMTPAVARHRQLAGSERRCWRCHPQRPRTPVARRRRGAAVPDSFAASSVSGPAQAEGIDTIETTMTKVLMRKNVRRRNLGARGTGRCIRVLIREAKMDIPVNIDATTTWLEKVSDSEYAGG